MPFRRRTEMKKQKDDTHGQEKGRRKTESGLDRKNTPFGIDWIILVRSLLYGSFVYKKTPERNHPFGRHAAHLRLVARNTATATPAPLTNASTRAARIILPRQQWSRLRHRPPQ